MVTQVNLKILIGAKKSSINNAKKENRINIDEEFYIEGNLGEVIDFEEYKKVWISLEGYPGDYVIFEKENQEYFRVDANKEPVVLTLGEENTDMITPGIYSIELFSNGKIFVGEYKVSPSVISYDEFLQLEDYIKGCIKSFASSQNYNLEEIEEVLLKRYTFIQNEIENISKSRYCSRNINLKAIKSLDDILKKIYLQYKGIADIKQVNYNNKLKHYNLLEDKSEFYDDNMNYIDNYLKESGKKLHLKMKQIQGVKDEIDKINILLKKLQRIRNSVKKAVKYLEAKSNGRGVGSNSLSEEKINIFTNSLYRCIKKENSIRVEQKTSSIFERAILFKISEILMNNGYYSSNIKESFKFGQIPEEVMFSFESEDRIIEIDYNIEIERYPKDYTKSQIVNIISKNCRPDIKLTVYDKKYKFETCIIIEVKCSKAKYLYAKEILTDKFLQILNYYAMGTYDARKKKVVSGGIERIIVPYPKQEVNISCNDYNIDFIPIDTFKDILSTGEKSEFENILKAYI